MASKSELAQQFAEVDLFTELPRRLVEKIAAIAREVTFNPGQEVVEEGHGGVGFHLILDGQATVQVRGQSRPDLGPGDYFGEISLVDGKPRSATVRAKTPLHTASLTVWDFQPLLERDTSIALALLRRMCARLRSVEDSAAATG